MKKFVILFLCLAAPLALLAQGSTIGGVPDDVYYLMPSFADGYVYIRGQMPARGKLNICAVNNSLRYIDDNGAELVASDPDAIVRVVIDTVSFLRSDGVFYRMYPVSADMGVALERKVVVEMHAKETGYGGTSQTAAVREIGATYDEGMKMDFRKDKVYQYSVDEIIFLYKGNQVFPLNKKNLRKLFPAKKDEIDALFKSGHALPETVEETKSFLAGLQDN